MGIRSRSAIVRWIAMEHQGRSKSTSTVSIKFVQIAVKDVQLLERLERTR